MTKPEKVFKVGPVRASIFRNPIQQNGRNILLPKVVIEVRYKDKSGTWKGTNSLSLNDLPKAVVALQSAYEYLLEKGNSDTTSTSASSPVSEDEESEWEPEPYASSRTARVPYQQKLYKAA